MTFVTVTSGDQAFAASEPVLVARSETEWVSLANSLAIDEEQRASFRQKGAALDGLDWAKHQLVFARAPEQPTGGYRLEVTRIVEARPGAWTLEARVRKPNPDDLVMQVITTPWTIVRTARTASVPRLQLVKDRTR